jgi:hypothetical protein
MATRTRCRTSKNRTIDFSGPDTAAALGVWDQTRLDCDQCYRIARDEEIFSRLDTSAYSFELWRQTKVSLFHHDLSGSIHDRDRNTFLVNVHADILGAGHRGCSFL